MTDLLLTYTVLDKDTWELNSSRHETKVDDNLVIIKHRPANSHDIENAVCLSIPYLKYHNYEAFTSCFLEMLGE